ncbi:hypothetical protein [Halalkalibacterium ligniniphilum]|uniref:hypothetical protein n=1 Tax=Halalkalibacterium ligniniphilum TaxID=1134413 RepID=UPI0003461106|nr:hypothetical protein [Halalkalibacterium ligniniphilum]
MSTTQTKPLFSALLTKLEQLHLYIKENPGFKELKKQKEVILFLSIGNMGSRATVFVSRKRSFERAWENIQKQAIQYLKKKHFLPQFLKIDWVDQEETFSIFEFIEVMTNTKKNYFRKGIALDAEYKYAFLEQEINANAFIQINKNTRRGFLHESNIKHYIKYHRPNQPMIDFNKVNVVKTFTTKGFFYHNGTCFTLKSSELDNGRRDTALDQQELKHLIVSGGQFLTQNNHENGKFTYGYFSCFDKEINFYNVLRHASTLYAMCEVYECFPNQELHQAIKRGFNYLVEKGIANFQINNKLISYVVDGIEENNLEIKLGANAAAILAFTKYTSVFSEDEYLPLAQQLAKGILNLQSPNGDFCHVLKYPSLDLKEQFRIVYYDGEAAFALMNLYKLDKDDLWLQSVEKAFDSFIAKKYWKHHDHWLSYCTNELTAYKPIRKYFQFGLLNIRDKLDFIWNRETTYPTFLELMLAAYQMVQRIYDTDHYDLLKEFDEDGLIRTIHKRAEYQRNGFFYPEVAMYFKNPQRIIGSYFIRHHSFRSRIDDVEHYLSGYCQYYKLFFKTTH